jgi:hypothetical protein
MTNLIICGGSERHLPCYVCEGSKSHAAACSVPSIGPARGRCRCPHCATTTPTQPDSVPDRDEAAGGVGRG